MQALGLIETKGLLAAIESADAMLKAAEVSLVEKTYVGGGLVTIAVTGDVGAVKAAVEAGAASVRKLNNALLLSEHVIPRPHQELDDVIVSTALLEKAESEEPASVEPDVDKEAEVEAELAAEPEAKSKETAVAEIPNKAEAKSTAKKSEATQEDKKEDLSGDLSDLHKEALDKLVLDHGLNEAIAALNKLKVVKLRNLAREYKDFGIVGRMISKADKKIIIAEFEKYFGQK